MISVRFQGKPFNITVIQSVPQPVTLKKLKLYRAEKLYRVEKLYTVSKNKTRS